MSRITKLEAWHAVEVKRPFYAIRLDTYEVVPGAIVAADEVTGAVTLLIDGETRELAFPAGIRLVDSRDRSRF